MLSFLIKKAAREFVCESPIEHCWKCAITTEQSTDRIYFICTTEKFFFEKIHFVKVGGGVDKISHFEEVNEMSTR
jgi:hypothetical protein